MTDLRTAAQQALEALKGYRRELNDQQPCDAERAIETALAEPVQDGKCKYCVDGCPACDARKLPVQEPVAWLWWGDNGDGTESKHVHIGRDFSTYWKPIRPPTPLYTAPPQRPAEPAGWLEGPFGEFRANQLFKHSWPAQTVAWSIPLYLAPPQRKPLTDEEIRDLWSWAMTAEAERTATTQQHAFSRAIERAHGITP